MRQKNSKGLIFLCVLCRSLDRGGTSKTFREAFQHCVENHLDALHITANRTCKFCKWIFKDISEYKKHSKLCTACRNVDILQAKAEGKIMTWKCQLCPQKFKVYREAYQHCIVAHRYKILGKSLNEKLMETKKSEKRGIEDDSPLRRGKRVRKEPQRYRDDPPIQEENEASELKLIEVVNVESEPEVAGKQNEEIVTLYKCPICQKKYLTQRIAIKHVETFHQIPPEIQKKMRLKILAQKV